jgi:YhcH/YjgK/YiaL family protein
MIVDALSNWREYDALLKIKKAFKVMKDESLIKKKDGRYEISGGEGMYYLVQRYKTQPSITPSSVGFLEAHKKYVDLQFILSGKEIIGYSPLKDDLELKQGYDKKNDAALFKSDSKMTLIKLQAGMFAVFFPQDAHQPRIVLDKPTSVVKVVVKIPVKMMLL